MKTYLVTGAAGFIGANYIKYILAKHNDIKVVILDALTYAGNLGTNYQRHRQRTLCLYQRRHLQPRCGRRSFC